jgi:hypothetical protein
VPHDYRCFGFPLPFMDDVTTVSAAATFRMELPATTVEA